MATRVNACKNQYVQQVFNGLFLKRVLVIHLSSKNGAFPNLAHRFYYKKLFCADVVAMVTQ